MKRLAGTTPFKANQTVKELYKEIKKGKIDYPKSIFGKLSEEANEVVRGLLEPDPDDRFDSIDVLKHDWLQTALDTALPEQTGQNMKLFVAKKKFRNGIATIILLNRLIRNAGLKHYATEQRDEYRRRLARYKQKRQNRKFTTGIRNIMDVHFSLFFVFFCLFFHVSFNVFL